MTETPTTARLIPPVPYEEHERAMLQVIDERDAYHEMAERLAAAIAPAVMLGEHSNVNDPWVNALEFADRRPSGFVVAGPDAAGVLAADWDGEVHDLPAAREALADARQVGGDWKVFALTEVPDA